METLSAIDFVEKMAAYIADLREDIRRCDEWKDSTLAKVYRSKLCSAYEICRLFNLESKVFAKTDRLTGEAEWG